MGIIYCYKNKINGKTYVGQTNNPDRRIREHRSNAFNPDSVNYNSVFHRAVRKYGIESFEYSVLERVRIGKGDINDRERYWIDKMNSQVHRNGYNILDGGRSQFWNSKFSPEDIATIKLKIKNGVSYDNITDEYNVSKTFLSNINHGWYFFDFDESYPLYEYGLEDRQVELLLKYLRDSRLTFREIAECLDISIATVKKINYGSLRPELSSTHPIRKLTPQKRRSDEVKDLLINTLYTNTEIAKMTNTSNETVRRVNLGKTNEDKELKYPLRNL